MGSASGASIARTMAAAAVAGKGSRSAGSYSVRMKRVSDAMSLELFGDAGPTAPMERAALRMQAAFRGRRARQRSKARKTVMQLTLLMATAERRAAMVIQRRYRSHRFHVAQGDAAARIQAAQRRKKDRAQKTAAPTSAVAIAAKANAMTYLKSALDRPQLISKLRLDIARLMEKGKVYGVAGSQVITWNARYFFVGEAGLCYQRVSRKMVPKGKVRLIPWTSLLLVEALEDDSVYLSTTTGKRYYIKVKDSQQPAVDAWVWATRLCQLIQLLGSQVSGHVADAAYGLRVLSDPLQPPYVPTDLVHRPLPSIGAEVR